MRKIYSELFSGGLISQSIYSFASKVVGMLAAFGLSILLGRSLGVDGYGTFELANKIATFILVFTLFGTENIMLRETAIANQNNDNLLISSIFYSIIKFTGTLAVAVTLLTILFVPFISNTVFENSKLATPLIVLVLSVIFQTVSRGYSFSLIGLKKVWQGNLFNQSLGLIFSFLLFGITVTLISEVSVIHAAGVYFTSRLLVLLFARNFWRRFDKVKSSSRKSIKGILKPARKLLVLNGSSILTAGVSSVLLGIFLDEVAVGLFLLAERLASLTITINHITSSVLMPKFAVWYSQNNKKQIEKLSAMVIVILSAVSLAFLSIYIFFGAELLSIWGEGFNEAYTCLVILTIGQLFCVITGPTGPIMLMAKADDLISQISVSHLILATLLNVVLISYFGLLGAAVATLIVNTSENVTKIVVVKRKLGIGVFNAFRLDRS